MVRPMSEDFWLQAAILFWFAVCFFRVGAAAQGIAVTWRAWAEIAQAAAIVVLIFALLSGGQGVDPSGPTASAAQAGGSGCARLHTCTA